MNVQCRNFIKSNDGNKFLGCVTTDAPETFKLWLAMACPTSQQVLIFERNDGAIREEGGYRWRLNIVLNDRKEALMFKLRWYGA